MHTLITSYLLQTGECILPEIGILKFTQLSAKVDPENNKIIPPSQKFSFKDNSTLKSPALVKYIAEKKNISFDEADEIYNQFCKEWKVKINSGEKLILETVGSIKKNIDGKLLFEKESGKSFLQPIQVDSIYKKDEYSLAVSAEADLKKNNAISAINKKSYWQIWAAVLIVLASLLILWHFKDQKLSVSSTGNQQPLTIDSAKGTYQIPNK